MTAASIPALLEPIQERLDAATPGPWQIEYLDEGIAEIATPDGDHIAIADGRQADAECIAHSPTDIARLLAAVKAVADLADAWQARGDHLLKYAAENRFPDGVAESLSESGAEFVHSAKLVRSAVEAALRGEA